MHKQSVRARFLRCQVHLPAHDRGYKSASSKATEALRWGLFVIWHVHFPILLANQAYNVFNICANVQDSQAGRKRELMYWCAQASAAGCTLSQTGLSVSTLSLTLPSLSLKHP